MSSDFDVAILGGGPVGTVLALLLAQAAPDPARIALLRSEPARKDPRAIAMNHGSRVLLATLDALPSQAAGIDTIHVSQRGRLGRTLIRHSDFDVPMLGCVVEYDDIQTRLEQALTLSGISVCTGAFADVIAQSPDDGVTIRQGDDTLHAALAIRADGAPRADLRRDYGQHAVLTTVTASRPRPGWAWERFTREGPLALLPHPDGLDQYSLVWCCAPERAAELQALDDAAFSVALNRAFGERLGALRSDRPRAVFPLSLSLNHQPVEGRTVVIGNAAQTLHPVAGQGLNLGLRDAARLALALSPWLNAPHDDPTPLLADFAQARRADRWLTAGLTDLLPRVFATGQPLLEHAGGLALLALDVCAPLRAPLARHLLQGLRG